ncbi:hypothetical protein RHOSPDRAFT_37479 [Rhodotorula sp. JG-1b]|nr:hypothetical protein RHOSPDRAFT_37479 [Rhodotorula sp. JG-1b]
MRAESHSEADLPPLPSPPKAPYTEQEIDFEVPAYIKSLVRAQAGGAGRSEEDSPLADDHSASSSSEAEDGDFEHATMDKATDASNATLIDKAWDLVRQDEALVTAASGVEKLGQALAAALNTPGEAGRKACAKIYKEVKLQVDKLGEAMTEAEKKGQVFYELQLMNLVGESEISE